MRAFVARHPYIAVFIALAIGMQVVLYSATRGFNLAPSQYAFIAAATVLLAALCVWISTWE